MLEPFGEDRADLRAGIISSTIANVNRDPKKSQPFAAKDFMPDWSKANKPKPKLDAERSKQLTNLMLQSGKPK